MESISLGFLTDQQARHLFRQELEAFFSNPKLGISETPELKVVDLDGLLESRPFIGSRSTIYKKVSRGEIPHSKSGKRLIFDLNEVDKWLLSNKVKSPAEIEAEADKYLSGRHKKRRHFGPRS